MARSMEEFFSRRSYCSSERWITYINEKNPFHWFRKSLYSSGTRTLTPTQIPTDTNGNLCGNRSLAPLWPSFRMLTLDCNLFRAVSYVFANCFGSVQQKQHYFKIIIEIRSFNLVSKPFQLNQFQMWVWLASGFGYLIKTFLKSGFVHTD